MRCSEYGEALSAYLDDELSPSERHDVRAHLAACARCAREHDALAATSRTLREQLVRHRAPDVLKARIRSALAEVPAAERSTPALGAASVAPANVPDRPRTVVEAAPRRPLWRYLAAAAVIALSSSGVTYRFVRGGATTQPSVGQELVASHIRSLMPGHVTDVASNDQHNVKPWFNGRVDLSPTVPRLEDAGFPLLGGRLDYVGDRPVAVVVYTRRQHVINVYSWPAPAPPGGVPGGAAEDTHGYHLVRWRQNGAELWAVSDLNRPELEQFVALFQARAP